MTRHLPFGVQKPGVVVSSRGQGEAEVELAHAREPPAPPRGQALPKRKQAHRDVHTGDPVGVSVDPNRGHRRRGADESYPAGGKEDLTPERRSLLLPRRCDRANCLGVSGKENGGGQISVCPTCGPPMRLTHRG